MTTTMPAVSGTTLCAPSSSFSCSDFHYIILWKNLQTIHAIGIQNIERSEPGPPRTAPATAWPIENWKYGSNEPYDNALLCHYFVHEYEAGILD